jgi:hypothetical protein
LDLKAFCTAEEAQKSVKGLEENVIHAKYIELVNVSPIILLCSPGKTK